MGTIDWRFSGSATIWGPEGHPWMWEVMISVMARSCRFSFRKMISICFCLLISMPRKASTIFVHLSIYLMQLLVFQNETPAKNMSMYDNDTRRAIIWGVSKIEKPQPLSFVPHFVFTIKIQWFGLLVLPPLDCFPRTAIRKRWEEFAKSRNEGAPANVSQFYGRERHLYAVLNYADDDNHLCIFHFFSIPWAIWYTLWWTNLAMERSTIFNRNIHYFDWAMASIANC